MPGTIKTKSWHDKAKPTISIILNYSYTIIVTAKQNYNVCSVIIVRIRYSNKAKINDNFQIK